VNKFFLLSFICLASIALQGQDSTYRPTYQGNKKADKKARINRMIKMEEEGELIFNKQNIFGIKLATDGYGVFFEKGYFKTPTKTTLLQFELNEKKSPKEKTISSGDFFSPSEVLLKLNNFYQFKVSIGQQRLIGGKGNKNGVAITAIYTGGISLGILKPYYVNVYKVNDSVATEYQETYTQILSDTSTYLYPPVGAAGFTVGWGHLSLRPGLNAKAALRFDYGRFNTSVTAIEAGVNAEFYFSKVPQVYNVPYKNFFFNGYVTIMFGSRK
jgi:hypothetical protein